MSADGATVHPTAIVAPDVELGAGVVIGPYCVVGTRVRLGARTRLVSHVVVDGPTEIGEECTFFPFASIGVAAQHRSDAGADGTLVMGARNVVREQVTIHRGIGAGATILGSDNLLMVGVHVAHDVTLGSHITIANGVQLAGHVAVEDFATFGGMAAVAQHLRVGESAFVAAGAMCERDVPPFVIVQGDRARVRALNVVGLRRRGFADAQIAELKRTFRGAHVAERPRAPGPDASAQAAQLFEALAALRPR